MDSSAQIMFVMHAILVLIAELALDQQLFAQVVLEIYYCKGLNVKARVIEDL